MERFFKRILFFCFDNGYGFNNKNFTMTSNNKLKCGTVSLKTDDVTYMVYVDGLSKFASGGGFKKSDLSEDESFRHLYFYSERTIAPGNYFYSALEKKILHAKTKEEAERANNERDCYNNTHFKIEASTDESLKLPLIENKFIDEYAWLDGKIKHLYISVDGDFFNPIYNKKGYCIIDEDSVKCLKPGQIARNMTGYWPKKTENPRFYSDKKYQEGYLDAIENLINAQK